MHGKRGNSSAAGGLVLAAEIARPNTSWGKLCGMFQVAADGTGYEGGSGWLTEAIAVQDGKG